MKKLTRFCSAFLTFAILIGYMLTPSFAAYSSDKMGFSDTKTHLQTSYCDSDFLDLTIEGSNLKIRGRINKDALRKVSARLGSSTAYADVKSGDTFEMLLPICESNESLAVFLFASGNTGLSYVHNGIQIIADKDGYCFAQPPVRETNKAFYGSVLNPDDYILTKIPREIKELSDSIVGEETDNYKKLFLLNQWVAENIYYDYDYYYHKTAEPDLNPLDIIASKKTVCAGYANLMQELVCAQDIPCIQVKTYALGIEAAGSTFSELGNAEITKANHATVDAYVDNRWVIMDPTWDSNNKYENGQYLYKATYGYYYFDITPEAFSLDHKIISRGSAYITSSGDVLDPSGSLLQQPSTWAKESVEQAISQGLVPSSLQKNYTSPITRGDVAQMFVNLIEQCSEMTIDEFLVSKGVSADPAAFLDTTDKAVLACNALGIISGVGDKKFDPTSTLTRAQMAAILNRTARTLGVDTAGYHHSFTDLTGHWCNAELGWPVHAGIINGIDNNQFAPDSALTIEQAISIIARAKLALA